MENELTKRQLEAEDLKERIAYLIAKDVDNNI
jgi:hypothetical protein